MKVLILTMTCGEGHNAIARTMTSCLEARGVTCKTMNIYEKRKLALAINDKGYRFLCVHMPRIYSFVWKRQRYANPEDRYKNAIQGQIKGPSKDILAELEAFRPDSVLCTHIYAAVAMTNLTRFRKTAVPFYSILTDYALHPFWESAIYARSIFTPSDILTHELLRKGYRREQLTVTGFPTHPKFDSEYPKEQMRLRLNLQPQTFTIIVMSGGYGLGNTVKLLDAIQRANRPVQIVCINGRNERMQNKVAEYLGKNGMRNVVNLGFCTNVDEYMSAADMLFCRAGCTTLSEALNKKLPMVIRENAINQELENRNLLYKLGIAAYMDRISDATGIIQKLYDSPELLQRMRHNGVRLRKPGAADRIAQYMVEDFEKGFPPLEPEHINYPDI